MRRLTFFAGALVAAASLSSLSSCATFDDADTVASVNGQKLTVEQLDVLAADELQVLEDLPDGRTPGDVKRAVLSAWIQVATTTDRVGTVHSLPELTELRDAVLGEIAAENGDAVRSAYELGIVGSPLLCLAAFPIAADVAIDDVLGELASGLSFAAAAQQYSTDESLAAAGGIIADGDKECLAPEDFSPELTTAIAAAAAEVGTPVALLLGGTQAVVLLRPFDEVTLSTDDQVQLAQQAIGAALLNKYLAAEISVSPRVGTWDVASQSVVAHGQG